MRWGARGGAGEFQGCGGSVLTPPTLSRSPFKVKALPTHDASKVKASGPGLNTTGVPASLPVEFTIDAKDAGEGLLAVQITVGAGRGARGRAGVPHGAGGAASSAMCRPPPLPAGPRG